ncbi:hypothetical protein AGMMS50218_17350 [Actinomycetota bacterium]|nr:hypothetical protein AGMMS50218_17350 [Actinomycetota bacterium]
MSLSWITPADVLTEHAEPGWAGIWTLTHAAARGALHLADALPLLDSLDLIYAASFLREARGNVERVHPGLPAQCAAVDLGPLVSDEGFSQAILVLNQLTTGALNRTADLLGTDLTLADVLTLLDVESALVQAREKILRTR